MVSSEQREQSRCSSCQLPESKVGDVVDYESVTAESP